MTAPKGTWIIEKWKCDCGAACEYTCPPQTDVLEISRATREQQLLSLQNVIEKMAEDISDMKGNGRETSLYLCLPVHRSG